MRYIDNFVQRPFMRRRGWRGKWVTAYLHDYSGEEKAERFHTHPWRWAFGIVLSGLIEEDIKTSKGGTRSNYRTRFRCPFSIQFYRGCVTYHRIQFGRGRTVFIGLFRRSWRDEERPSGHMDIRDAGGWCHYTELRRDEVTGIVSVASEGHRKYVEDNLYVRS